MDGQLSPNGILVILAGIDLIALWFDRCGVILLTFLGWLDDDGVIISNLYGSIVDHLLNDIGGSLVLKKMVFSLLHPLPELDQLYHGRSLLLLFNDGLLFFLLDLSNSSPPLIAYFA